MMLKTKDKVKILLPSNYAKSLSKKKFNAMEKIAKSLQLQMQ